LPISPPISCDCSGHDPCKASRHILILLCSLDTGQNLLDAHTNILTSGTLFDFSDRTVDVIESSGFLQDVCKFLLRVDVGNRNLGIKAAEEVELGQYRTFGRSGKDQQAAILH
jgi:hypothetical protein